MGQESETEEVGAGEESDSIAVPPLPSAPLPPLTHFTRKAPSRDLAWHLVDVLYSYCFVHRMRNGHFGSREAKSQAASTLGALCL